MARAWPTTMVEEGSLRVHIGALRKTLGDGRGGASFIANIPGRGYTCVAPVSHEQNQTAAAVARALPVASNLPGLLVNIIGRTDTIATVAAQLARRRLLTIVGAGGIGKTTVAVAVAGSIAPSYSNGVWFVALASLSDPGLVTSAIGTTLGAAGSGTNKR
jgi:ABC-type glutathione transport system ATPase component